MTQIQLGNRVRDLVSGFTGIATARTEYMNGCVQFAITSSSEDGTKEPVSRWLDTEQLEFVDGGVRGQVGQAQPSGGDRTDTPPAVCRH